MNNKTVLRSSDIMNSLFNLNVIFHIKKCSYLIFMACLLVQERRHQRGHGTLSVIDSDTPHKSYILFDPQSTTLDSCVSVCLCI